MKFLSCIITISIFITSINTSVFASTNAQHATKTIRKVNLMNELPTDYSLMDFKETAVNLDKFLFEFSNNPKYVAVDNETYLPIGFWDDTNYNRYGRIFGLPSYIGANTDSGRSALMPASQEAITTIGAVSSGLYAGIDKTDYNNLDFVNMMLGFNNRINDVDLILNNVNAYTGDTFWYEMYPQILFNNTYLLAKRDYNYYNKTIETLIIATADKYINAYPYFVDDNNQHTFDFTSFDFNTNTPVNNGRWIEPSGGAAAYLMINAYALTNDIKYIEFAKEFIFVTQLSTFNPYYEVIQDYNPLVSSYLNFNFDTNYKTDLMLNWIFDGDSDVRTGMGVIDGKWGEYQVDGLVGTNDRGGYGFLLNTYHLGSTLAPIAKYDSRYSNAIGKWFLASSNSIRLMYPNEMPNELQLMDGPFAHDVNGSVAYEGLRRNHEGKTPFAMGDAVEAGWANTDYGIYGSVGVGSYASIVSKTDVPRVLQLDLNATDLIGANTYPQYLYYNPYDYAVTVTINDLHNNDIFDVITKEYLVQDVSGTTTVNIEPKSSINVVITPKDSKLTHVDNNYYINDILVAKDYISINVINHDKQKQIVKNDFVLKTSLVANDLKNTKLEVRSNNELIYEGAYTNELYLGDKLFNGLNILDISVYSQVDNLYDTTQIKVNYVNYNKDNLAYSANKDDILNFKPVDLMPAKVTQSLDGLPLITEVNDEGDWGAIESDEFIIDFDRTPYLLINTSELDPVFTLTMKFYGEDYGKYIISNSITDGDTLIDVKKSLKSFGDETNYIGEQVVTLFLTANGIESASFKVSNIEVFYID